MNHLLSRAWSVYRDLGARGLAQASSNYVRYGSFRHDMIGSLPVNVRLIDGYVSTAHRLFPQRYTDAAPSKRIWIDPCDLSLDVSHTDLPRRFGRVCGGDWDNNAQSVHDTTVYRALEARFNHQRPWEETRYYQRKRDRLESGLPTRGCSSIADLPAYFSKIEQLYEAIADHGYLTQETLARTAPRETEHLNLDAPCPVLNEIGVSIGRAGTLYRHYRGLHRLTIAQLLDLDEVPIQILVRHHEWQRIRNDLHDGIELSDVSGSDSEELLRTHPDLRQFFTDKRTS